MKKRELHDSLFDLVRHGFEGFAETQKQTQNRIDAIANVLSHMEQQIEILIREQNALRNAIKELKNVNDGR